MNLAGVTIRVVAPGTKIGDTRTGQEYEVTTGNAVGAGNEIYMTSIDYESFKLALDKENR